MHEEHGVMARSQMEVLRKRCILQINLSEVVNLLKFISFLQYSQQKKDIQQMHLVMFCK